VRVEKFYCSDTWTGSRFALPSFILEKKLFLQLHLQSNGAMTFRQNDIQAKRHSGKTTFRQNDIQAKRHSGKTTFRQNDIQAK
jgi:hypothetical protein